MGVTFQIYSRCASRILHRNRRLHQPTRLSSSSPPILRQIHHPHGSAHTASIHTSTPFNQNRPKKIITEKHKHNPSTPNPPDPIRANLSTPSTGNPKQKKNTTAIRRRRRVDLWHQQPDPGRGKSSRKRGNLVGARAREVEERGRGE